MIRLKRAYEKPAAADGTRILVDRLWPRGLTKREAGLDMWMKEVAPSPELRKWFGHDPEKWAQFQKRYRDELRAAAGPLGELRRRAAKGTVTLVYAAREKERNSALLLKKFLEGGAG